MHKFPIYDSGLFALLSIGAIFFLFSQTKTKSLKTLGAKSSAKTNPFSRSNALTALQVKNIFRIIHKILPYATKLGGTSTSDYRDTSGQKGKYGLHLKVYRQTGKKCKRKDGGIIQRKILNQRFVPCRF